MPATATRLVVGCLYAACLAGALDAQHPLFHVGGPTPNFADLPAAVAAVPPGSLIKVWPGVYTGFSTTKALRIELAFTPGGGLILPAPGSNYTIQIHGLLPGDAFALVGHGSVVVPGLLGALRIFDTGAPVFVEGITVAATSNRSGLEVDNAAAVLVHRSIFAGTPALQMNYASFVTSECVILSPEGAGAIVNNSLFESSRTFFTGTGLPALSTFASAVRLAGDGLTGLTVLGPSTASVSAFEAVQSIVQWRESRFPLAPLGGAPGFAQYGSTIYGDDVPMLITTPAAPGTVATVLMSVGTPAFGLIMMGLLTTPSLYQITGIYFDTVASPLIAGSGIVDSQGLQVQTTVPTTTTLLGELLCFQGVIWLPGFVPVLSGPGIWAIF